MWGPVLGWCVLQLLAESIDAESPERVALDLFDRLRLREPYAQAFAALGFEDEEGWRVAARIKIVLLTGAGVGKKEESTASVESEAAGKTTVTEAESAAAVPTSGEPAAAGDERVALAPDLWFDPDVRWLTGVHEAEGHAYLVRELYEELLWWLLMPSLLRLGCEAAPSRAAVEEMSKTVEGALATAEAAGYRIDALLGTSPDPDAGDVAEPEAEFESLEPEQLETEGLKPQEPEIEPPAVSAADPVEPA
jgi:hypothetical protein